MSAGLGRCMPDDRVKCVDCHNLRAGWCVNARNAGLVNRNDRAEVSKALSVMPQRCPGFRRKTEAEHARSPH